MNDADIDLDFSNRESEVFNQQSRRVRAYSNDGDVAEFFGRHGRPRAGSTDSFTSDFAFSRSRKNSYDLSTVTSGPSHRSCAVSGCPSKRVARGYCAYHNNQIFTGNHRGSVDAENLHHFFRDSVDLTPTKSPRTFNRHRSNSFNRSRPSSSNPFVLLTSPQDSHRSMSPAGGRRRSRTNSFSGRHMASLNSYGHRGSAGMLNGQSSRHGPSPGMSPSMSPRDSSGMLGGSYGGYSAFLGRGSDGRVSKDGFQALGGGGGGSGVGCWGAGAGAGTGGPNGNGVPATGYGDYSPSNNLSVFGGGHRISISDPDSGHPMTMAVTLTPPETQQPTYHHSSSHLPPTRPGASLSQQQSSAPQGHPAQQSEQQADASAPHTQPTTTQSRITDVIAQMPLPMAPSALLDSLPNTHTSSPHYPSTTGVKAELDSSLGPLASYHALKNAPHSAQSTVSSATATAVATATARPTNLTADGDVTASASAIAAVQSQQQYPLESRLTAAMQTLPNNLFGSLLAPFRTKLAAKAADVSGADSPATQQADGKTRRRRKKMDEDKPKKPKTAYTHYQLSIMQEVWEEVQANPLPGDTREQQSRR